MTDHHLEPAPETTIDVFDRATTPVLTVDPGDTVVVRSLDAIGHLERQQKPGEERPLMFNPRKGHCLTGPIEVRGAAPGSVPRCAWCRCGPATGAGRWLRRGTTG
jgi:acetamidase/formamidase